MEARAKRFNLEKNNVNYDEIVKLYDSLGIPAEERDPEQDPSKRSHRLGALHVRGFGAMRAEDVYEYFKEYNPVSLEWVDGNSANVVWALPPSCARALIALSKPILPSREEEEEEEEESAVNQRVAGEGDDKDDEDKVGEEGGEAEKQKPPKEKAGRRKLTKDEIIEKFDSGAEIFADELVGPLPDGKWRVGKPCPQADLVLMRIATAADEAGGDAVAARRMEEEQAEDRDFELYRRNQELSEYTISFLKKKQIVVILSHIHCYLFQNFKTQIYLQGNAAASLPLRASASCRRSLRSTARRTWRWSRGRSTRARWAKTPGAASPRTGLEPRGRGTTRTSSGYSPGRGE